MKEKRRRRRKIRDAHTEFVLIERIFQIVTIMFIAPNKELNPAICKEKIKKSTLGPECAIIPLNGG